MLVADEGLYNQFKSDFQQFYDPLCKYAFSFIKERDACEDIVQEIFVRIWESRQDLVGSTNLRYYLFTAARNNSLTYLRHQQRLPTYSLSELEVADAENTPDTATINAGDTVNYSQLLGKGIDLLPPKCKEVFLLSHLGDLSNQEVANSLGISVKTVNNQLWKALKFLRGFAQQAS